MAIESREKRRAQGSGLIFPWDFLPPTRAHHLKLPEPLKKASPLFMCSTHEPVRGISDSNYNGIV
jgi:hypothetical protein